MQFQFIYLPIKGPQCTCTDTDKTNQKYIKFYKI